MRPGLISHRSSKNIIATSARSAASAALQAPLGEPMTFQNHSGAAPPRPSPSLLDIIEARSIELRARRRLLMKAKQIDIPDGDNSVLVVIAGQLSAAVSTIEGRDAFLSDVVPGEIVGESFAFGNDSVPLALTVSETTEVWSFNQSAFVQALRLWPDFAIATMNAMCRRQCRTNLRMAESVTLPVAQRLVAELLRLVDRTAGTALAIERLPPHREIAARIATHREAVTKGLSRLERSGALQRVGSRLILVGPLWTRHP